MKLIANNRRNDTGRPTAAIASDARGPLLPKDNRGRAGSQTLSGLDPSPFARAMRWVLARPHKHLVAPPEPGSVVERCRLGLAKLPAELIVRILSDPDANVTPVKLAKLALPPRRSVGSWLASKKQNQAAKPEGQSRWFAQVVRMDELWRQWLPDGLSQATVDATAERQYGLTPAEQDHPLWQRFGELFARQPGLMRFQLHRLYDRIDAGKRLSDYDVPACLEELSTFNPSLRTSIYASFWPNSNRPFAFAIYQTSLATIRSLRANRGSDGGGGGRKEVERDVFLFFRLAWDLADQKLLAAALDYISLERAERALEPAEGRLLFLPERPMDGSV